MPETGTVEFLKLCGILITNQKSDLVRNDLHTKLTPVPRVLEDTGIGIFWLHCAPDSKETELGSSD